MNAASGVVLAVSGLRKSYGENAVSPNAQTLANRCELAQWNGDRRAIRARNDQRQTLQIKAPKRIVMAKPKDGVMAIIVTTRTTIMID